MLTVEQQGSCESVLVTGTSPMRVPLNLNNTEGTRQGKLSGWPFFWLLFFGHAKKSDSSSDETETISN
jgi:hypothetical protein